MSANRESEWYDKLDAMEQDAMTFHLRPDPKPISKGVQRVLLQPDRVGWARISDSIRKYDEEKVSDVKEDIDVLLVLAGLFSAVMTSFVLDSYSRLQQIRNGPTNAFFAQMSLQLLHINRMAGLIDPSLDLPATPPPQIDPMSPISATRINILWSSSLVLSLLTASFGMFIKQWIHAYMALENRSPIIQLRIRFFREDGLAMYGVWEIAALLPILLQSAFLLFLIGFAEFILQNDPTLGWIVVSMMATWFFAITVTTIIPFFSSQCPYKSPLWRFLIRNARWLIWGVSEYTHMHHSFNWHVHHHKTSTDQEGPKDSESTDSRSHRSASSMEQGGNGGNPPQTSTTWSRAVDHWGGPITRFKHRLGHLVGHFEENMIRTSSSSDIAILARAQNLLLDQELADHIRRCAEAITLVEATEYMKARLRLSPFKPDCKAMKSSFSSQILPKDRRWHASFPRKADHLLYEILSYTLDAHFKFKFKKEADHWGMLVPDQDTAPVALIDSATSKPGELAEIEHAEVDESLKTYAISLGVYWKFRVVYESLTYVTFFACHARMTHSSAIWRALQGDVVHFSWLAQSFPHIAINFIQSGSPLMGVCFFMSLYSAISTPASKFTDIHNQLCGGTDEFRKEKKGKKEEDQRGSQAKANQQDSQVEAVEVEEIASDTVAQKNTSDHESQDRQTNKHFVSEIPGGQEVLYRKPDGDPMSADYINKLTEIYDFFHNTDNQASDIQDEGWKFAHEALVKCFEQYGWASRTKRKSRISYVFLILLRLVPTNFAREAQTKLDVRLLRVQTDIDDMDKLEESDHHKPSKDFMDAMKDAKKTLLEMFSYR